MSPGGLTSAPPSEPATVVEDVHPAAVLLVDAAGDEPPEEHAAARTMEMMSTNLVMAATYG
jgi:hypothetical protein